MQTKTGRAARKWLFFTLLSLLFLTGCGGGTGKNANPNPSPSSGAGLCQPASPTTATATNAIAGGLTALAPAQQLGTDLVMNPGFESGSANWSFPPCFSVTSAQANSGTQSLLFTAGSGCGSAAVASTSVTLAKGMPLSYTLQGCVMTSAGSDITVKLSLHDATQGGNVAAETDTVSDASGWTSLQRTNIDLLPIHTGDTLSVQAVVQGITGTAGLDDIQLIPQEPLPM